MLLTDAQLEESFQILPEIAKALSELPQRSSPPASRVEALRAASAAYDARLLAKMGPAPSTIVEFYHIVALRDGHTSAIKITKPSPSPTATTSPGPLILLFFSGAFLAGSPDQLTAISRALTHLYAATCISISYRLAPEHPFPTAVHDAIDSAIWVATNATSPLLHSDPTKGFIIGGASSGGNLAAVLSRYFQTRNNEDALPYRITGQWVGIAQLFDDSGAAVPERYRALFRSREQNAHAPVLNAAALAAGALALRADVQSELRFPVVARSGDGEDTEVSLLEGQPRTYLQVCGLDPLRDDGLIYEEMLREAGVQTRLDFYGGCPHGFWLVVPEEERAGEAVVDVVVGLGWLLGNEVGRAQARAAIGTGE